MQNKLLIILFSFFSLFSAAQEISFESITADDGLSQNDVNCILQDHQGFLWIGTNDGLDRFDGYEFKSYRFDVENGEGLNSNLISSLAEDPFHNIWVGTSDRGVNLIRFEDDKVVNVSVPGKQSNSLESENINNIKIVDSLVYILAKEHLYLLKCTDTGYEPLMIHKDYAYKTGVFANYILEARGPNEFLLGTSNGIRRLKVNYKDSISINNVEIKKWVNVGDIKAFRDGYLVSCSGRMFFLNKHDKLSEITKSHYHCLLVENDSVVWGGGDAGIHRFTFPPGAMTKKPVIKNFTRESADGGLESNIIRNMYQDDGGIIWLGTAGGGVSKLLKHGSKFQFIRNNRFSCATLNGVNCFFEDSEHKLWLGLDKEGFIIYKDNTSDYHSPFKHVMALEKPIHQVQCFYELKVHGIPQVLVGTNYPVNHKVYTLDGEEMRDSRLSNLLKRIVHPISAMISDSTFLWIATYEGGLYRYNYVNDVVSIFRMRSTPSLKSNLLNSLLLDTKKRLWIGSNKGLHLLSKEEQLKDRPHFTVYEHAIDDASSLSNNYVVPIIETHHNEIWFGTFGGGLNKFEEDKQEFTRYTTLDGLSNNTIKAIVEDDQDRLWISSNQGLTCFDPAHHQWLNFSTSDGLQSKEFSKLAFVKRGSGELLFGGKKGFNAFFPQEISIDTSVPKLVLTQLQLKSPLGSDDILINRSQLAAYSKAEKPLVLKHNENSFTAYFSALHFLAPHKIKYRYRLLGFEEKWTEINSNSRFAKYTNLHAGDYKLEVKATNSDGIWIKAPLSLLISIKKPWFRTPLAYLFYGVFFILLFLFFKRYSVIRNNIKQSLLMERFEKEKEKELTQTKLRFFTNISHELRTPLSIIKSYFDDVAPNWDSQTKEKVNKDFAVIRKNVDNLLQLVAQILDFRKLEQDKLKLLPEKGNIVSFTQSIRESFEMIASSKHIELSFTASSEAIELWFDRDKMQKILNNLLSNAIKYTPEGGHVNIVLSEQDKDVKIGIHDNGVGIPASAQANIFDRFYRVENSETKSMESSGIGLSLTKGLVELHQGRIELLSSVGKGSSFILFFKKGEAHLASQANGLKSQEQRKLVSADREDASAVIPAAIQVPEIFNDSLVLIVEDNDDLRAFLQNKLAAHFKVQVANNGKAGLDICKKHIPDLLISDVMMPQMNGYELCHTLKNDDRFSHIPVILLTAKTADESKITGYKVGADAYVSKPFNMEVLLAQIVAILESRVKIWKNIADNPFYKNSEITFNNRDEAFLNKITDLIDQHISDPTFKVGSLVALSNMSQDLLNKKIKALTGKTSVQYLRFIRIRKAAQLLKQKDSRVADVTYDVGYSDLQHFRQHFKQEFDLSPSAYKKQFAEKV